MGPARQYRPRHTKPSSIHLSSLDTSASSVRSQPSSMSKDNEGHPFSSAQRPTPPLPQKRSRRTPEHPGLYFEIIKASRSSAVFIFVLAVPARGLAFLTLLEPLMAMALAVTTVKSSLPGPVAPTAFLMAVPAGGGFSSEARFSLGTVLVQATLAIAFLFLMASRSALSASFLSSLVGSETQR